MQLLLCMLGTTFATVTHRVALLALRSQEDDDLEVSGGVLSLRCPLSAARITTPARFSGVAGQVCDEAVRRAAFYLSCHPPCPVLLVLYRCLQTRCTDACCVPNRHYD